MSEENKKTLSDEGLGNVNGGFGQIIDDLKVIRRDSKGNPTHFKQICCGEYGDTERIFHYVCPHCGGLLHQGFLGRMYCDPCDEGWFMGSLEAVNGFYPGCE